MSLVCAIILGLFDKRAEIIRGRKQRNETGEKIHVKDIKGFSGMFWLVVIICVTFYVTIVPFVGIATYVYLVAWL